MLNIAVAELPKVLEPAMELNNVGTRVTYSVFDTVIRRDFKGSPDGGGSKLLPHLATSWKREDAQTLLVTFRNDVKFHNGDLMTAEDVAYTFRDGRLWGEKPQIPGGRAYFGTLAGVEAVTRTPCVQNPCAGCAAGAAPCLVVLMGGEQAALRAGRAGRLRSQPGWHRSLPLFAHEGQ